VINATPIVELGHHTQVVSLAKNRRAESLLTVGANERLPACPQRLLWQCRRRQPV